MKKILALAFVCLCLPACYRTIYRNLRPPNMPPAVESTDTLTKKTPRGWQHFFIWGIIPFDRRIDAAALCGGEEHIDRIETEQTFLQRLIESFAGYYVNVYAPYNAHVVCDHSEEP